MSFSDFNYSWQNNAETFGSLEKTCYLCSQPHACRGGPTLRWGFNDNLTNEVMTNGIYTVLLLIMSNVFMTFAWYGHLRLQQSGVSTNWPLYLVIAFSWMIAFFEYCCQVPANRIGFVDNGGPFNLVQLKVIQECISLVVFAVIANLIFQHEQLHWNHAAAALCLVAAVYFVFMKP